MGLFGQADFGINDLSYTTSHRLHGIQVMVLLQLHNIVQDDRMKVQILHGGIMKIYCQLYYSQLL